MSEVYMGSVPLSVDEQHQTVPLSAEPLRPSEHTAAVFSVNGKTGNVTLDAADVGAIQVIVEDYSSSQTYPAGAYSRHNNKLYRSIANISTPELWNDEHWAVVTVANELSYRYKKPSTGIPKSDLASAVQTSLNKANTALQSVPSTYRTAAAQDVIDAGKQAKITASGILKGNGSGGVSAAVAGTDYETPAGAKALGLTGASVGDIVRVAAVDANGKPTSWQKAPLCDIVTNENILDNWYFVGGGSQQGDGIFPINQRGQQNYSGAVYGADRWRGDNSSSSVTLREDGLLLGQVSGTSNYGRLRQELDFHAGLSSVVTFSAILKNSNGGFLSIYNLTTGSAVKIADSPAASGVSNGELLSVSATIPANTTKLLVSIQSGSAQSDSCVIVAAKLELGSEQTLAHQENDVWVLNEIPDYGEELLKCQRYLLTIASNSAFRCCVRTGNYFDFWVPTPVSMASSVTVLGAENCQIHEFGGSVINGFSYSVPVVSDNGVRFRATKSSHGCTDADLRTLGKVLLSVE